MKNLTDKKKETMSKLQQLFIKVVIGINIIFLIQPAKAFIPYVYEPNKKELESTSIDIAKTAAQLLHLGQTKEATRLALLAISIQPNNDLLWAILAETQIRSNKLNAASKSLQKAKELNPTKASLWFAEASVALLQKKPNVAEKLIKQGLNLEPNNADAYFQLGNVKIMQSQYRLALDNFKQAITIKPIFWEALNNQGIVLFELGKAKKAVDIWRNVLKINKNAEPMLALAAALNKIKPNNQESIDLAKEALAKNPNYVHSEHQKEQLWGKKLQKAAKQLLMKPNLDSAIEKALANSDPRVRDNKQN